MYIFMKKIILSILLNIKEFPSDYNNNDDKKKKKRNNYKNKLW
jgi:hypothetical protein